MSEDLEKKLLSAYDAMMERVHKLIKTTDQKVIPTLHNAIEQAKLQAIELKEITEEEADKLGSYLKRDIHDFATHLAQSGQELSSWLSFDIELIEDRLFDAFNQVADCSQLQLARLADQAEQSQYYHTGEFTRVGKLQCTACQALLQFKKTSRIPPCPKCRKTEFIRC